MLIFTWKILFKIMEKYIHYRKNLILTALAYIFISTNIDEKM